MSDRKYSMRLLLDKILGDIGADGLCNPGSGCGCGAEDLAPCDCLNLYCCIPARWVKPKSDDSDYWAEYPDGYYKAIE